MSVSIHRSVALGLLLGVVACGSNSTTAPAASAPYSQTDLVVGTGGLAIVGSRATVAYTGWLYDPNMIDGKGARFDSGSGFGFTIGAGQVIRGWDQGVPGMRVGGERRLVLPPNVAYGSAGAGSAIPPNATLVFDIVLLAVQ